MGHGIIFQSFEQVLISLISQFLVTDQQVKDRQCVMCVRGQYRDGILNAQKIIGKNTKRGTNDENLRNVACFSH